MKKPGRKLFTLIIFGMLLISFTSFQPVSAEAGISAQAGSEEPQDGEPRNQRVSVASDGTEGNNTSLNGIISDDGNFVAFSSQASNLVENDTNGKNDVFVHNRQTGITELVSVSSEGVQGNNSSGASDISEDGRYIVFTSSSTNLVQINTGGYENVYLHDRNTAETKLISSPGEGISANGGSSDGSISPDGRFITFTSFADNLVENDTNSKSDIFLYDCQTEQIELISKNNSNELGNAHSSPSEISVDGNFVVFASYANNLVPDDTNDNKDIFLLDRNENILSRISVSDEGVQGNSYSNAPKISNNGQFIIYMSTSNNLVPNDNNDTRNDVFIYDRLTKSTKKISFADEGAGLGLYGGALGHAISGDGRYISFSNDSQNSVANISGSQHMLFLYDRELDEMECLSFNPGGIPITEDAFSTSISGDGTYISFNSWSNMFVQNDTNSTYDVFVINRLGQFVINPEIEVLGGAVEIENNDLLPSIENQTDYGEVEAVIGSKSNTFSINNTGVSYLNLIGNPLISITGEHAEDFSVVQLPDPSEIYPNDPVNFVVTFSPSDLGQRSAVITIENDDADENPFIFAVQGVGVLPLIYPAKYDDDEPTIFFPGNWDSQQNSAAYGGGYKTTSDPNAEVLMRFHGNGIKLSYLIGPGFQDMDIYLDGELLHNISQYNETSSTAEWVSPVLALKDHALRLTPSGGSINLDSVEITSSTKITHLSNPLSGDTVPGESWAVDISADGRYAVFKSEVNNLVANDTCSAWDIFVVDVQTGEKRIANRTPDGVQRCGQVYYPSISADGRYVSFTYIGENLVTLSPTRENHVYLHDMQTNENIIVSVNSQGEAGNDLSYNSFISDDGRFAVFMSLSDNLVENDSNDTVADVFVHNVLTGETELISVDENGDQFSTESGPTFISSNGRYVGFVNHISTKWTSNGTITDSNAWLYDRRTKQSILISTPNSGKRELSSSNIGGISEDGRYVVFSSNATNLVENDTNGFQDVFLKDMVTGEISLISRSSSGEQGNDLSSSPEITSDGRYVFFSSHASNLVANDNNGYPDIFLFDRFTNELSIISKNSAGLQGDGGSSPDNISADGLFIVFSGDVPNFRETPAYDNGYSSDVYLLERLVDLGGDSYEGDGVSALGTLIQSGQSQTHSIKPAWDEDWLTLTLDGPGVIMLETSGTSGDTILRLFDDDHNEIASDDHSGANEFSYIVAGSSRDPLPAGTYYVKVEEDGDDAVIEEYSIHLLVKNVVIMKPGTYDDSSTAITYTGSWSQDDLSGATEGHWHVSTAEDGEAEVVFTGKQIRVIYGKDSDLGTLAVYIDEVLVDTIDENAASAQHQQIWESNALSSGEHTLRLVHSSGTKVVLDGLTIFAEALPEAPRLLSPGGTKYTNDPLFIWYADSNASGYWLTVGRSSDGAYVYNSYVTPNTNGYTCWFSLPGALSDGEYWFKVTAGNGSGWGAVSEPMNFKIAASQPPEAPTLISPSGAQNVGNPLFVWYTAENTSGYWLTVGRSSDGAYVYNSYVTPNTNGITCWFSLPGALSDGEYWFKVTAGNASGWGESSEQMEFSISLPQPPEAPALISPNETVDTNTPLFVWYAKKNATGYWLTVGRSSDGTYLFNSYVQPNTNGYTCWFSLPVSLSNGDYWFKVTAGNAAGWGVVSEPMNFSVSVSQPPEAPTLIAPSGAQNTGNPLFVWYATKNASGYWLTVGRSSDGAYLFNSYVQPNTNGYTCWLNLPVTFEDGNYWFRVTAGNASGWGDASEQMEFVIEQ